MGILRLVVLVDNLKVFPGSAEEVIDLPSVSAQRARHLEEDIGLIEVPGELDRAGTVGRDRTEEPV